MTFDETTPHSTDAESALLSIALQWPDHIDRIEAHPCGINLFFIPGNRDIYAAALAMRSEQKQIEIGTLSVALESSGRLDPARGRLRLAELFTDAPSPALADQYLEYFDGMSIGSNDMTQLALGLDRDSALVAEYFDERDDAVKALLAMTIQACKAQGKYVGICGQGPSDHLDFAQWLMDEGIDSVSLNPDSVLETWFHLAENAK